ncbi:MAG TPA: MBL fold metallo-hydrolase [Candidatus Saccharimonadales bacterium]|nr:MBL fold metallo-hydrolase [Candidatus Saccharimonadales bacterium]
MEIEYKGGNAVVISTKKLDVLIDPKLSQLGLKDVTSKHGCVVATQAEFVPKDTAGSVVIDGPGEYEVDDISINGVAAERMIDHDGSKQSTIYRVATSDVTVAVIGHSSCPLSEQQLETLSVVDIVVVPVGGNGYTLNANQAVEVVRQLEPKVVIPTHYADKAAKYEVPQDELELFTRELAADVQELPKLKIKNCQLPEVLTVYKLTRVA